MLENFQRADTLVLATEGGYVDDPHDPGGATNLGVTIGTAKQLGLDIDHDGDVDKVDIKLLKPADAAKVYKHFYWDTIGGDQLPAGLDYAAFDFAVNSGVGRARDYLAHLPKGTVADQINFICDRRLAFLQSLSNWSRYGRGWGIRVASVRKVALAMAAGR